MAKEYLHLREWLNRAKEIVDGGEATYMASHLLPEAGDSLLMKIGEAANRLTRLGVRAPDGIDWANAVSQRNWLIHQYDQVDRAVTWATLTRDLPALEAALQERFEEAEICLSQVDA